MDVPTIGAIVWYRPGIFDFSGTGALGFDDDGPLAAMVVAVHSPTLVSLTVFSRQAVPARRLNVPMVAPDQDKPSYGYAEWPAAQPTRTTP